MKTTDTLSTLLHHHVWSNIRLIEACSKLTPEQLDTRMVGAFGSIIETLQHFVSSEQSYASRIKTGKRYDRPDVTGMTFEEMLDSVRKTGADLIEYAPKVQPDDLVEVDWEGTPRMVPLTILVVQAITHAAEHREQVKAMVTQLGIQPPDWQAWEFFDLEYEGF